MTTLPARPATPLDPPLPIERSGRRRRTVVAALVTAGALAVAIPGIGTLASFTSTDTNKTNIVASGDVGIAFTDEKGNPKTVEYVNVPNAAPSMPTIERTITIANTGSLEQAYRLSVENVRIAGRAPLDKVLAVRLLDADGNEVYAGTVSRLGFVAELPLAARDAASYQLLIDWPDNGPGADNAYQASSIEFDLTVNGESTGDTTPAA